MKGKCVKRNISEKKNVFVSDLCCNVAHGENSVFQMTTQFFTSSKQHS